MSLLQTIQADALAARKARDSVASSLLITLGSEAAMTGLNDGKRLSSDEEVLGTIRKFLKNNQELLKVRPSDEVALREKQILEGYLPKQLSEEELRAAVLQVAGELGIAQITGKDTGALMKGLAARHSGQYSGQLASQIIKQMAA